MSNSTTITGNLTREPEIRYTQEGQATTHSAWPSTGAGRTATQEWQESTSFFDVVCWRDLAENVALSLSKGMRVIVSGRFEQRSWETEDGEHRSKVEIVADEVGLSLRFATAEVQRTQRRQATEEPSEPSDAEAARSEACGPSRVTGSGRWPDPGHGAPEQRERQHHDNDP